MIWFSKKTEQGLRLPCAAHLAVIGRALVASLALFVSLSVATQLFVPGLMTDRVSPAALAAVAVFGLALGSPERGRARGGTGDAAVTLATVAVVAWAAWTYFQILPEGRLPYTMLLVLALLLVAWPRRDDGPDDK